MNRNILHNYFPDATDIIAWTHNGMIYCREHCFEECPAHGAEKSQPVFRSDVEDESALECGEVMLH